MCVAKNRVEWYDFRLCAGRKVCRVCVGYARDDMCARTHVMICVRQRIGSAADPWACWKQDRAANTAVRREYFVFLSSWDADA